MDFKVGQRVWVDRGTGSGITERGLVPFSGLIVKMAGDNLWVKDEMRARNRGLKVPAADCMLAASIDGSPSPVVSRVSFRGLSEMQKKRCAIGKSSASCGKVVQKVDMQKKYIRQLKLKLKQDESQHTKELKRLKKDMTLGIMEKVFNAEKRAAAVGVEGAIAFQQCDGLARQVKALQKRGDLLSGELQHAVEC